MIRVLVADDQPLARAGLAALLAAEDDIEVVATASDGIQALESATSLQPDVACLDVRMPGLSGIEVARALAGRGEDEPAIPVLILTTFDIDEYVFEALEAGASGFLLKDAEPEEIVRAVRNVAAGNGTLDQAVTRRVLREFSRRRALQRVSTATEAADHLTPREREILELLAQGMSNDEIAEALTVEVSTVKSHLVRILTKLGVRSRLQAVVWAYQNKVVTPLD
ncbi:response regulator transcription factor [Microbacterium sp. SMR1]|uniref:response regulator n=1 Tax=Microbacterium sp. SMR1 TaxID=1497340 RepID=UPI000DCCA5DC|nr:response regulator transcription factor [Microbacterium sp. SMR1]RAZ34474.1 DNA-binding response regulator [Microbacterium sp. SMR1]